MENMIIIGVILIIVGGASAYIYRAKKRGKRCIGCPDANSCCDKKCSCCK